MYSLASLLYLNAFPVRMRPARPARWSAEALDTGTIMRLFVCVSASNQGILTKPQSITAHYKVTLCHRVRSTELLSKGEKSVQLIYHKRYLEW